jgi:hypothetical protein
MDLIFEILIPSGTDIPSISFEEPFFEWQGEKHPQGSPEAGFGSNFILVYRPILDFVRSKIPAAYASIDWQCIGVKGSGLELYRRKLWINASEDPENTEEKHFALRDLLHRMCADHKWIIVIDNDEPFEVVSFGNLADVIIALDGIMKGEIQENGFLICGEGSDFV